MTDAAWLAGRVATAVATLAALSVLIFWATEVLPGDAVGVLTGQDATPAEREAVRLALGLDRPPLVRYADWAGGALHGDLGVSLVSGREVAEIVAARASSTLAVLLPATALLLVLAIGFGTAAGLHVGGRLDRVLSSATATLISTPDFLIATGLLLVLAVWVPLLPGVAIVSAGQSLWQHPELVVLPALALALGGFGATMRLLRASVAQTAQAPFAEFARLNGARGARYATIVLTNALGPAVQGLALMIAGLLGGSIVVETLFNVPGLGSELTRAVADRDVPLVQGLGLLLGAGTLSILLAGDLATRFLRTRADESAR